MPTATHDVPPRTASLRDRAHLPFAVGAVALVTLGAFENRATMTVLPTVAPEMSYDMLGEVREGDAVQRAYLEAINPLTPASRKAEIARALLEYCQFDTHAMVRLTQAF